MALNVDVRELIRADILSGAFPFGARLRIEELSARYRLSHTPIREALRELGGEGLVTIEPNRGARVRVVDVDMVDSLFDLRIAIEAMLTRRAAARINKDQLARLEEIESELEIRAEAADAHGVLLTNRRFHDLINDAANNPHASEIVSRNWHLLSALWQRCGYPLARVTGVASDHRHLIRALSDGDGEAAAMIATAHAAKAKADLIRIMRHLAIPPSDAA